MKYLNGDTLLFSLILVAVSFNDVEPRIGHFWHVTDFHLDTNYTTDGDPSQMCWSFGKLNNIRPKIVNEYGNYDCDAPIALVRSAINAMKTIFPSPDFIVWTGDDTAHVNDSFFSTDIVVGVISEITDALLDVFPDSYVLPVLGNHDLYPQNQAPVGPSDLQNKVADLWKSWLDPFSAYADFKNDGRYVAHIPGSNVSFVAFNTLLWYQMNAYTANDPEAIDPAGQFAWADQVIQSLADAGRKVYLMGHIPPGSFERYFDNPEGFHWYQERYNRQYIDLINKHWFRVEAQLYGHHHTDSFRVFLSEDLPSETPISYLLIAPAVSPMRSSLSATAGANNPGVRLITYDTETGQILEVSQYFLDISRANEIGLDEWILEYNLTSILGLNEVNAASLYDASLRLQEDVALFDVFYPTNTVQWENATSCSSACRVTQFCSTTAIDYSSYSDCQRAEKEKYNSRNPESMPQRDRDL